MIQLYSFEWRSIYSQMAVSIRKRYSLLPAVGRFEQWRETILYDRAATIIGTAANIGIAGFRPKLHRIRWWRWVLWRRILHVNYYARRRNLFRVFKRHWFGAHYHRNVFLSYSSLPSFFAGLFEPGGTLSDRLAWWRIWEIIAWFGRRGEFTVENETAHWSQWPSRGVIRVVWGRINHVKVQGTPKNGRLCIHSLGMWRGGGGGGEGYRVHIEGGSKAETDRPMVYGKWKQKKVHKLEQIIKVLEHRKVCFVWKESFHETKYLFKCKPESLLLVQTNKTKIKQSSKLHKSRKDRKKLETERKAQECCVIHVKDSFRSQTDTL